MNVVILLAGALLGATSILALVRAEKGPSVLDRALALDILTGALVGAIALEAAWSRRIDTVPILVAVSLVGFVASVTVARFVAVEAEGEGRILTRDELAALENERIEADAAQRASTDEEHHGGLAHGEVS